MLPCNCCGTAPERRQSPDGQRVMFICPTCHQRGAASSSEAYARATWERGNNPALPTFDRGRTGRPRFFERDGLWGTRCTVTRHEDHGYLTFDGALAGWMRLCR